MILKNGKSLEAIRKITHLHASKSKTEILQMGKKFTYTKDLNQDEYRKACRRDSKKFRRVDTAGPLEYKLKALKYDLLFQELR